MVPLPELRTSWHLCSLEPTEQWAAEPPKSQTLFLWGFARRNEPPQSSSRSLGHAVPVAQHPGTQSWHGLALLPGLQGHPGTAHSSWAPLLEGSASGWAAGRGFYHPAPLAKSSGLSGKDLGMSRGCYVDAGVTSGWWLRKSVVPMLGWILQSSSAA